MGAGFSWRSVTASGGGTRATPRPSADKTPPIDLNSASQIKIERERSRSNERRDSTKEPCRQTRTNTATYRPPDAKKVGDAENPLSVISETQSPSTCTGPEKTKTGNRSPYQTRPPDPQRRPTDPPESALTSNCRPIIGLEVDGAAEVRGLRWLRRRPRRQPAVSAAARACRPLRRRPKPPPRPRAVAIEHATKTQTELDGARQKLLKTAL